MRAMGLRRILRSGFRVSVRFAHDLPQAPKIVYVRRLPSGLFSLPLKGGLRGLFGYGKAHNKEAITIRSSAAEYLSYVASVGDQPLSVELRYEDENIWLTQRMMAELYGVSVSAINQHLRTIFDDNELTRESTIKKFLIVLSCCFHSMQAKSLSPILRND